MATNPYQFDPFLQQAFGNLSNALLGSASNDADIALGTARKAQAENSLQAALANEALARGRNAEAMKAEKFNENAELYGDSIYNQQRKMKQLFPSTNPQLGGSVVPGGSTGFVRPNVMADILLATGANDLANSTATLDGNVRDERKSRLVESLITSGDPAKMRQGFALSGNNPGKYYDEGFANTELTQNNATDISKANIEATNKLELADLELAAAIKMDTAKHNTDIFIEAKKRISEAKIAAANATSKEEIAEMEAELADATARYKVDQQHIADIAQAEGIEATKRYEFDNRTVTVSVNKNQRVVVDPTTGAKLNLTANADGYFVMDGMKDEGDDAILTIGKKDVYVPSAVAIEIGATFDEQTKKWTFPTGEQTGGTATTALVRGTDSKDNASSSGGDRNNISTADDNLMLSVIDSRLNTESPTYKRAFNQVPEGVMNFLRNEIVTKATIDLGNQNGKSGRLAAQDALRPYLRGDVVMSREGFDFGIPAYMYEFARNKIADGTVLETGSNGEQIEVTVDRDYIISSFVEVNYEYKQASKIADMLGL